MPSVMLESVRRVIRTSAMLGHGDPVQVAVSGGVDSMVLLHVLRALGHPVSIVHVDHGLRGSESSEDRAFVATHARSLGIPCTCIEVDVRGGSLAGESVQMTARRLRYAAFADRTAEGVPLALGHHRDDAVETLLLNLMRGTGIAGLAGMPAVTALRGGRIIRPLAGVGRAEILEHAAINGIPFREDSSNASMKYVRNRLRHEVLPLMERIRPGALNAMGRSVAVLAELVALGKADVQQRLSTFGPDADGIVRIPSAMLGPEAAPSILLQAFLSGEAVHPDEVERVLVAVQKGSLGARFTLGRWRAQVERGHLALTTSAPSDPDGPIVIEEEDGQAEGFTWAFVPAAEVDPANGKRTAWLDADRLSFPLRLRPWRDGDRMRPIGLQGSKLVSDILTDAKVMQGARRSVHVLESDGTIVWVVGYRIGAGHGVSPATTRVFRIRSERA